MDIVRNELADKVAKQATEWRWKQTKRGRIRKLNPSFITIQISLIK